MDAGTNPEDHYRLHMAGGRFAMRQQVLYTVRRETEILADMQARLRSPWLDRYFALTANLGTHTFYMIMLPAFYWYGSPDLGRDTIWVLALGVYLTGLIKDYLCLPRPRSPPLHRISMSGSAMLEYGFPSTHSCNAVSVAILLHLYAQSHAKGWPYYAANALLVLSITLGRLYTGMHGFLDVACGIVMGVLVWALRVYTRDWVGSYFADPHGIAWLPSFVGLAVIIVLISTHPQPVDNCPCFEDSVAFLAVLVGVQISDSFNSVYGGNSYEYKGILLGALRFVIGVGLVISWRFVAKKNLLRYLPPLLRKLESLGVKNPRRYFLPATEYDKVPTDLDDDDVIPDSPRQITEFIREVRKSRGRNDSVGPQSAADLYEARARAAELRRNSTDKDTPILEASPHITEPRLRYDVEVITKVIVYMGISFVSLALATSVFEIIGI